MCYRYSLLLLVLLLQSAFVQAEDLTDLDFGDDDFTQNEPIGHRFFSPMASLILPGAGQIINDEYEKGAFHLGAYATFTLLSSEHRLGDSFEQEAEYFENNDDGAIYLNNDKLFKDFYTATQLNTTFYSAFDAYRVATLSRDNLPEGDIPVSTESFGQLALAPFTPRYLGDPYVFVPLAVAALYLIGRGTNEREEEDSVHYLYSSDTDKNTIVGVGMLKHEFVSIGEESFFRGYVNTEAVRHLGPTAGIATSSLAFGLVHTGTGASANALVATGYGLYLGFLHYRKRGQLGYNIALHYWWNVAVVLSVVERSKEVQVPLFEISF